MTNRDRQPPDTSQGRAAPRSERRMMRQGLLFAAPAAFLLLVIYILPLLFLNLSSMTDYKLGAVATRFVGIANFIRAAHDPVFLRALENTLLYALLVIPFGVGLALWVALLVHRRKRSRTLWEVVYFLPVTSTLVAMASVWQFVLHPTLGPVNALIRLLGFEPVAFLSTPALLIPTIAAIGIWQVLGFNMVLFLTGLKGIPSDIYEAARLDGVKSPLDRFLTVTWPMLGATTMFVTVTTSINAFKVFETVAVLTQGKSGSETLLYALYLEGFLYADTGYAAALTLIFLALMLILSLGQFFHFDRRVHYR